MDALTGEGLAVGLASAEALVEAIIVGRPEEYAHAWRDLTRTSRVLTETLLRGTRVPMLRHALVPAARALPWVFRATVAQLA